MILLKESFSDLESKNIVTCPENLINVSLDLRGSNNKLIIENGSNLKNTVIRFIGSNNTCIIKSSKISKGFYGELQLGHGCTIILGHDITVQGRVFITTAEESKVEVGNDCMFSAEIQVRAEDSHAIYDVETGNRINRSKDIFIGDHVWIGYRSTILQGSYIGEGSVIGFGSIVKGNFPNNVIVAGIPAKIQKTNVAWERPHISYSGPVIKNNASEIKKTEKYWNFTKNY